MLSSHATAARHDGSLFYPAQLYNNYFIYLLMLVLDGCNMRISAVKQFNAESGILHTREDFNDT